MIRQQQTAVSMRMPARLAHTPSARRAVPRAEHRCVFPPPYPPSSLLLILPFVSSLTLTLTPLHSSPCSSPPSSMLSFVHRLREAYVYRPVRHGRPLTLQSPLSTCGVSHTSGAFSSFLITMIWLIDFKQPGSAC